jgi:hypothetical protein
MSLIEEKIAGIVLDRIRARKSPPAGDSANRAEASREATKAVSVREAKLDDFEQVRDLNLRLGQGPDSLANWRRLWLENPALLDGTGDSPIGWKLETSQGVVGFLGTVPLRYEFEGDSLRVAATCRFAVEPAYRAFSHLLVVSFFRQKNVDLFLNTTATVAAGKIMMALKASPLPQPDYGTVLFWVLDPRAFTKEVLKKLGVKTSLIGAATAVGSVAMKGEAAFRVRGPKSKRSQFSTREIALQDIGPGFEHLWTSTSREPGKLSAARTPEIMKWHFDPPGNRRAVKVFGTYTKNELLGYIIVRYEQSGAEDLRRALVADVLVRNNDPEILEQLFAVAASSAKNAGCHVLEVMGFPRSVRQVLLRWKPYSREYPACPFFFKARNRELHEKLMDERAWYACPFDGDSTLWP